ncbi:unnamed protein product [Microthlaspi erraticum]|uniref:Uncharacterized protein n=1 Tax=Microthlaspi erraticum TaxID=1685480 RepID=A0A6D2IH46_9BRAS|nr:unnamed protein product [Microthlaspi erraticum]
MGKIERTLISALVLYVTLLLLVISAAVKEANDFSYSAAVNTATDLKYKIIAIFSTLIIGAFGVCIPIFGLDPHGIFFLCVRILSPTAIIATCFILLNHATESLTSYEPPWGDFPMTRAVATASSILTMVEVLALASMNRSHSETWWCIAVWGDKEEEKIHVDNSCKTLPCSLGFVVSSVIIGISLGATSSVSLIKPLIAATNLHQLSQGIYLGGRFSKAILEVKKTLVMVMVYSLTTPVGIGIGIGVAEIYKEYIPATLMLSGFSNAAAAGILNCMAIFVCCNQKAQRSLWLLIPCAYVFYSLLRCLFYRWA